MKSQVEYGRMYGPAPDPSKPNERPLIYLETSIDQVMANAAGKNLKDELGRQVYISQEPPGKDVTNAIWYEVTGVRPDA